jgi:hypothetical protein
LRDFSVDAIKHKWKHMIRIGLVKNAPAGSEHATCSDDRGTVAAREAGTPAPSSRRDVAAADAGGALRSGNPEGSEGLAGSPPASAVFGIILPDGSRQYACSGLGKDGVYSESLTNAIEAARRATGKEIPPEKGSRARLPDGIVEELQKIIEICKGPGGDPRSPLPRGILKELMSFLAPFCSPVTLQKRMSAMAELYVNGRVPAGAGFD